jgi:chemotaxis signal transduction protein
MTDRARDRALIEAVLTGGAEPDADDGAPSALVFEAGGAERAVDASLVETITRAPYIARVPYAPAAVLGVASVRGRMRLVVDAGGATTESGAFLVVLKGDANLAILADRVLGVRRAAPGEPRVDLVDPDALVED